MNKELLTVEFRYHRVPKSDYDSDCVSKEITIGVYETLNEAIIEGNKILENLSSKFEIRGTFGAHNGVFGSATRLVCDCFNGYPQVFCKITQLKYDNIDDAMNEVFNSENKYRKWVENI